MINKGALIASLIIAFVWVVGTQNVQGSTIGAVGQLVGVTVVLYAVFFGLLWAVGKIRGEPNGST